MPLGLLSTLFGGMFASAQQDAMNDFNAREAKKNRDFQSREAELNRIFQSNEAALQRDWSAAEAERARDWNEEMYAKYNSLSGKIAQAEHAGVNPMFAVTGNAVSPASPGASAPSGASAGSVGTPSGASASSTFVDIVGAMLGFKKVQAETDLLEAEAERNRKEAEKTGKETSWIDSLSQAQLDNLTASTDELSSRIGVNYETANKLKAEFAKLNQESARLAQITDSEVRKSKADALLSEWLSDNKGWLTAAELGTQAFGSVVDLAGHIINSKTRLTIGR